jgi:hypothetical protein
MSEICIRISDRRHIEIRRRHRLQFALSELAGAQGDAPARCGAPEFANGGGHKPWAQ